MAMYHNSFSQVLFATMILILASNGKAKATLDSSFCAQTNAGEERVLCNTLVNGATTWNAALSNVIDGALKQVKPIKPIIDDLGKNLPSSLRQVSKDSIVETCKESYESVVDEFNGALGNIKTGDKFGSINTQLSAALSSLTECVDALGEFGVDAGELKKFQSILEKYASLSLAVSSTKTT
ncbi:hypothetical protein ACH5RR_030720 [Cinchona calisaya]|uniref:Pectinesterase inhibitor domain-containing protein n=1 Tax=Cinchona calisaya TaxID=153742 RepID=A0ABD2YVG5_9GENT